MQVHCQIKTHVYRQRTSKMVGVDKI